MVRWPQIILLALFLGGAAQHGVAQTNSAAEAHDACVVLLHGLGRTGQSMQPMAEALSASGYATWSPSYSSLSADIDALTQDVFDRPDNICNTFDTVHYVTHSLGGILVRRYLHDHPLGGRVVMLSPPNSGSEIPDWLIRLPLVGGMLGPTSLQLGTDPASVPNTLGPGTDIASRIGVITGNRSSDPWFSGLIPGPDDGKVSVASAKLDGAGDFLVVPYGHTFIMRYRPVIAQTLSFLRDGRFQ